MNRTLVISSIFLLISCGIGLDDINDDSKRNADWAWHVDADGIGKWVPVRQKENDVPDGDVTWFYDNGFTHSFTRMVNNERVDTTWYYSHLEERKLIKIHIEKEGVESWWFPENGDFIKYTKKGDLFESGEVVANKHGSHWTVYHSNGKPSFIEKRNLESGKRNYSNYFVTGQISDTSEFKNGLVHGISKIWNKRGVLIEEAEWEEGAESGKVRHYYSDGTLKLETDYVRGRKHGLQHVFFKNGQLESTSNWSNDIAVGRAELYFESGAASHKVNIIDGIPIGDYFYESGEVFAITEFIGDTDTLKITYYTKTNVPYFREFILNQIIFEEDTLNDVKLNPKEFERFNDRRK